MVLRKLLRWGIAAMSDIDDILRQYGQGYVAPQLDSGDGILYDTSNVVDRMPQANPFTDAARILAQYIRRDSRPDNVLAGGIDTAANWVDARPQIGQDTLAPLGMGIMGSMVAPANAAGIFGGRLAKTADQAALARAEQMAASGAPRDDIWRDTGWFMGQDGKWRFEIDDSASKLEPWMTRRAEEVTGVPARATVGEGFHHPELAAAYPSLGDTDLALMRNPHETHGTGSYRPSRDGNPGKIDVSGADPAVQRSVALHELQHAIQQQEGFARGDSPSRHAQDSRAAIEMIGSVNDNLSSIAKQMDAARKAGDATALAELRTRYDTLMDYKLNQLMPRAQLDPYDAYRRASGEVEARNVQARRDFSPEARMAVPPWRSQDVPDVEQILSQYRREP